jgi:hypothetical protein
MMKRILPIILILLFVLSGCLSVKEEQNTAAYKQISQEEAKEMMSRDDSHVIVDVRRQDEYDAGHIPGAILIPNESIDSNPPEVLPDHDQIILIYCRTGNRSKQAAEKLAAMGYTNIYEFGGINTWTGEIVTEEPASASTEEAEKQQTESANAVDEEVPMKIRVTDGTHTIIYKLNDSPSAKSLYSMLPMDIEVEDYGSNEKIFYPEEKIDTADGIEGGGGAGDLALFSPWGNVVMFYDTFSSYPGLYLLGTAEEGADQVKGLSGTIHIEAEE